MSGVTALVLAGSRGGVPDPMARAAGVAHKALLPVDGVPMLSRVLHALQQAPGVGRIVVCAQQAEAMLAGLPDTQHLLAREGAASPSLSVAAVFEEFGAPLLVTTADHPLLTPAMVDHFLAASALPGAVDADILAGTALAGIVRAAFPDVPRTWLNFRDGAVSGCNLFLLRNLRAAAALRFWSRLERHRKRPLAMARLLGPAILAGYALRLLTLEGVLQRLGRRLGARLAIVDMPFAEAAVDVDKPADLALANSVLAQRRAA